MKLVWGMSESVSTQLQLHRVWNDDECGVGRYGTVCFVRARETGNQPISDILRTSSLEGDNFVTSLLKMCSSFGSR